MTSDNAHKTPIHSTRHDVLICLFLIIATLAIYWQVRVFGFVNYDDPRYIINNPHVQNGLTMKGIAWSFTLNKYDPLWHPLTWISLMLGCQIYGMDPCWHHLTNVFLHMANALFLFFILRRATGDFWRSSFVAAIFALHPLNVESVAWVTERKNVLSTFFWMLTMWSYIRYAERPVINRYLLVLLFLILGLMSKMMLVTLPFAFLLLDYWPLKRSRPALRLVWEKTPLFVLVAAFSVLTFIGQQKGGGMNSLEILPFHFRIANALVSYASYIGKMIWPHHLPVLYPYPGLLPVWKPAGACLLLLVISFLVLRARKSRPYLAVGWFWYIGILVPVIGLVQVGNYAMANRYAYVPAIGLFIIVAWGLPELVSGWRFSKTGLATITAILLSILMASTWSHLRHWTNSLSLFEYALDVTKNNYVAENNLAIALWDQKEFDKAIPHYYEALRINPDFVEAHNNLALALIKKGRLAEAIWHCKEALRIDPDSVEAHLDLGIALAKQRKEGEAIRQYYEALRIRPDYAKAHYNLGIALAQQGRMADAIKHYHEALRIRPDHAKAHNNLGIALAKQGKIDKAISHYQEALRIDPDFAGAHLNLGNALITRGKIDAGIRQYYEALRIRPDYADAKANLRMALGAKARFKELFEKTQKELKLRPKDPMLHLGMGNLYRRKGDLDEAINQYQEALVIKPAFVPALNNLGSAYAIKREDEKALSVFKKLVGLRPDNPGLYYNVACLYARQNRTKEALHWLRQAIEKGYNNWALIKTDKDLENIRGSVGYKELTKGH